MTICYCSMDPLMTAQKLGFSMDIIHPSEVYGFLESSRCEMLVVDWEFEPKRAGLFLDWMDRWEVYQPQVVSLEDVICMDERKSA